MASTVLNKPQTEARPLWQLKKLFGDGTIELSPNYQREVVWSPSKQGYLIDSLRNHYYVPPVVFALRQEGAAERWKLNVVDGKQRLTSIMQFYKNAIPSRSPTNSGTCSRVAYFSEAPTTAGDVLSAEEQSRFDALEIICVQYISLTQNQERQLFQRMQMGVRLTNAEKMHAIHSSVATLVKHIQSKCPIISQCMSTARMKSAMVIGQVIYMLFNGGRFSIPSHETMMRFLHVHELLERDERKIMRVFKRLATILEEFRDLVFVGQAPMSPIEFVFFTVLLARRSKFSNAQHIVTFLNCAKHVRDKHPGQVRARYNVMATLKEHVESEEADILTPYIRDLILTRLNAKELPAAFREVEAANATAAAERAAGAEAVTACGDAGSAAGDATTTVTAQGEFQARSFHDESGIWFNSDDVERTGPCLSGYRAGHDHRLVKEEPAYEATNEPNTASTERRGELFALLDDGGHAAKRRRMFEEVGVMRGLN